LILLRSVRWLFLVGAFVPLIVAFAIQAQTTEITAPISDNYRWLPVADGFNSPVFATHAGDGTGWLFVAEQGGVIFIIREGAYDDTDPFLDIWDSLSNDVFQGGYTERGLLGLAFHPDFKNNGLFFVNHTDRNGDTIIARYRVDPAITTVAAWRSDRTVTSTSALAMAARLETIPAQPRRIYRCCSAKCCGST
jgi:hypothetical protein